MSLSKTQFYKNSIWTFLELTSFPILVILFTPFFISKLGIEVYGLWMLINTITQGVNLLNVGIGDSSINFISKYRTSEQIGSIQKVFRFNFSFSIGLFLLATLLGFILYQSNFISLFYKTNDYHFANNLILLACVSAGIKFIEVSVLSVFKAFERFDLNSKLSVTSKCSVVILSVVLVLLNYNLTQVLFAIILVNILNIILQIFVLHQFNKHILQWPTLFFLKERREYIKYNFWYWLQSSIALVGFLADKLAVAWFTDVKTVGYYYIASMVGTNIHNFFLAFGAFIFPRVSYQLEAKDNVKPLYYLSRASITIVGWSIIFILISSGSFIFELWLGQETYQKSIYFINLYLVFEAGMLLIIVPYYFINASHLIKLNSLFEVLIRSSHFLCMLLGYFYFGVNGILYGLIFSTFLNVPFQYYYFHKKVTFEIGSSWLLVMIPIVFLLAYLFLNLFIYKLLLAMAFIVSAKCIYFDTAKPYIKQFGFFRKIKQ
jgi:O-antigen/teichoic acid export membrane protein